jgi:hypothetical protein
MDYKMERHVLDELLAQHHESGWREGYEQCRQEMTEECDKRIREAERHGGLADVGDRRDELIPRGRHLRVGRPHEVVITDELRHYVETWRSTPELTEGLDANDVDSILEDVLHFADHIDAEHRRRVADVGRAACNAVREVCGS